MSKISAGDIRVGNVLDFKNRLWAVLKREHIKPGKGGAFIQVEMKDISADTKLNHRFRSSEGVMKAFIEEEEYQYLFHDEDSIHLMNLDDFSQISVNLKLIGEKKLLLTDDIQIKLRKYQDEIIGIKLPEKITLKVTETEPYIKGQTVTSSYKPAILETGLKVMVPPFIKPDDKISVNTEDNSYHERVG